MTALCAPWVGYADVHALGKYVGLLEPDVAPFLMPATEILWRLSGRRWPGVCTATQLRPCKRFSGWRVSGLVDPAATWGNVSAAQRQFWWGRTCGCQWNACNCLVDELDLADYAPVESVDQIRIDGAVLNAADYALYDNAVVVRTDGGVWPTSQRLDLDDTQVGTWSLDLTYGAPPPADGRLAAAVLAAEMGLAMKPSAGTCALPERVQTVTRQGVTYLVSDPQAYLDDGRTGLYLVDTFLRSANPDRRRGAAVLGYVGMDTGARHRT